MDWLEYNEKLGIEVTGGQKFEHFVNHVVNTLKCYTVYPAEGLVTVRNIWTFVMKQEIPITLILVTTAEVGKE